ncbi:sialidase family protein [Plantibacter sp. YIM 135249]|uniref:sialidase family protein n=1 Tax=Plantibacter sp. YIM 135249 TaxID=3423918 RepID=UPI003D358DE1
MTSIESTDVRAAASAAAASSAAPASASPGAAASHPAPVITEGGTPALPVWQGIPGVAQTADGALWVTWYTGGPKEPSAENVAVLVHSVDDGVTWTHACTIAAPGGVRVFDPNLWVDPAGRLWHLWNQTDESINELFDGAGGVWARHSVEAVSAGSGSASSGSASSGSAGSGSASSVPMGIEWSVPARLSNGVSMNKPIVTADGDWLLPASVWGQGPDRGLDEPSDANVYASTDRGETWSFRGGAHVPVGIRTFDEHMIVERRPGELWMVIRTLDGLAESFSQDGGATWTLVRPSGFNPHTSSRVFFSRLRDGRIILVRNDHATERHGMRIDVSSDNGETWSTLGVIDSRGTLTYPDAMELADGTLAVVYDRERGALGEILLQRIRLDGSAPLADAPPTIVSALPA